MPYVQMPHTHTYICVGRVESYRVVAMPTAEATADHKYGQAADVLI